MRFVLLTVLLFWVTPAGAQTTFFSETFDSVVEPDLPSTVISTDASWKTSDSSPSPESGGNNAVHTGAGHGDLVIGPIDLSAALSSTFSYWARRTSSYSADSLFVRAGTDGSTFGTLLFGGGLPAASSSWEQINVTVPGNLIGEESVYLLFEGRGGSSSGSNMRIDDVLIEGTADPSAMETSFGFQSSTDTWELSSSQFAIPIDLEWPGPDSMQGFQFSLNWDAAVVSVDSVSLGPSAGYGNDWLVSSYLDSGNGSIAAVRINSAGLAPAPYPGLLHLHLSATAPLPATEVQTPLTISGLLATTNAADAAELSLPDGVRSFSLILQPSFASLAFSSEWVDFGSVAAGDSVLVQIDVSNPTGSAPLELAWTAPPSGPLNPVPTLPSSIPFGESAALDLWLRPQMIDGGQQSGTITILHNTASSATDLSWVALVIGGRGDADGDGAFDVADVIESLDGTVDPASISAAELPRHDLHPFPDGNGQLDIRDITVAIQAILRNQWPDGSELPVPPAGSAGKGASIPLVVAGDSLWIASPVALRGVQIELKAESLTIIAAKGASSGSWSDPVTGTHRLISLAGADSEFASGYQLVAVLEQTDSAVPFSLGQPLSLVSGMAVDAYGSKIPLYLEVSDDLPTLPLPNWGSFAVYPNPLPLGSRLHLDLPIAEITHIELFDAVGRRLWSDSEIPQFIPADSFQTPGTYFVRVSSNKGQATKSVVAFR